MVSPESTLHTTISRSILISIVAHCLDYLMQGVMCQGDIQIVTMRWGEHSPIPQGDFSNPHECVDWEKLEKWAQERAFTNAFEPGVLVHPSLGTAAYCKYDL